MRCSCGKRSLGDFPCGGLARYVHAQVTPGQGGTVGPRHAVVWQGLVVPIEQRRWILPRACFLVGEPMEKNRRPGLGPAARLGYKRDTALAPNAVPPGTGATFDQES
ncbi:MAG: hypothetical protein ACYTG0_37980 [Planctomycetota bacterium]